MENHSPKDHPVAEAALESGEVIADILMRGEILADIPLIGTAVKICKAADTIRDRAFAIKLSKFILNLEGITLEQKAKLKEKMSAGTNETKKIGETLFFVLEHITDLDKPSLLAQIFLAYIDEIISGEILRRLCQAVNTAFSDDLQQFLDVEIIPSKSTESWMEHLVPSGLTRLRGAQTIVDISDQIYCEITPLGQALRKAYLHTSLAQAQPA